MKKLMFTIAMATFAMVSCASSKQAPAPAPAPVKQAPQEKSEADKLREQIELERLRAELKKAQAENDAAVRKIEVANDEIDMDIPCMAESMDDPFYFRDYGTDQSANLQTSRTRALLAAKNLCKLKLSEFVSGVTHDYIGAYAVGTEAASALESKMQNTMDGVIEGMLNNAEKTCETVRKNGNGQYVVYYGIQISKEELIKKSSEALSADQKLGIDFNDAKFQEFAAKRAAELKEAKAAAGY